MLEEHFLVDSFGRQVTYLRISLTDRCNFRCIYCMPAEGLPVLPWSQYLTSEEIIRFVRIIGRLGVTRIRLTGGEPLLREDIVEIVSSLKMIDTVHDLSITTNGSQLGHLARSLKEAGLDRINISLDSLNPERFKKVTLSDTFHEVRDATFLALRLGFPVKLNMVALRGLTPEEIVDFVRLACFYPLEVRFLEFMPLCGTGWKPDLVYPIEEVRQIVGEHFDLQEINPRGDQVAQTFEIRGGKGKVGFIASVTEPFCNQCSRIRLSSDGKIHPCLFSDRQVSVKELLREKAPDEKIMETIRFAVTIKPKGNQFSDHPFQFDQENNFEFQPVPMIRSIGG